MRITKRLIGFLAGFQHASTDSMLVVQSSAPAGWGRPNTLNYCLENPGFQPAAGQRVLGTVAEIKAQIEAR